MYILFASFFISLLAIMIMLGRQVKLVRAGMALHYPEYHPLEPDIIKAKHHAKRSIKRYGYLALVGIFRIYFRAEHALKVSYEESKARLNAFIASKTGGARTNQPPREASGFLKMMSEYKHKLRNLRHKIKEEEEKK